MQNILKINVSTVFPLKCTFHSIPESSIAGASGAWEQLRSEMCGAQEMGRKSAQRMNWTLAIWFIENDLCRTFSMKTWRKSWPEIPSRPPMCPWWPVSQKNPSLTPPKTKMPCYLLQNNGRLDTKQWNCLKTTEVGTPSALAFWSLGEEETIFFFSIPRSQKKSDQFFLCITN